MSVEVFGDAPMGAKMPRSFGTLGCGLRVERKGSPFHAAYRRIPTPRAYITEGHPWTTANPTGHRRNEAQQPSVWNTRRRVRGNSMKTLRPYFVNDKKLS